MTAARAILADGGAVDLRERGSSTVIAAGLVGVAIILLVALAALGGVFRARAVAQSAADLGALTAATALNRPVGLDACGSAGDAVERAGAVVVSCELLGDHAVVVAEVATPFGPASARARAGPAEPG